MISTRTCWVKVNVWQLEWCSHAAHFKNFLWGRVNMSRSKGHGPLCRQGGEKKIHGQFSWVSKALVDFQIRMFQSFQNLMSVYEYDSRDIVSFKHHYAKATLFTLKWSVKMKQIWRWTHTLQIMGINETYFWDKEI